MKRTLGFLIFLSIATGLAAQPATPTCEKTLGITWADIRQCMAELNARYGGAYAGQGFVEQFPGAVFGYLPDGSNTPVINAVGAEYAAYNDADPNNDPIVWLGSVTKPFTFAAALVAIERGGYAYNGLWKDLPMSDANKFFIEDDNYEKSRTLKKTIRVRDVLTMTAGFGDSTVYDVNNSPFRDTTTQPAEPVVYGPDSAACRGNAPLTQQYVEEPGLFNECVKSGTNWVKGRNVKNSVVAPFLMSLPLHHGPLANSTLFPLVYSNRSAIMAAWLAQGQSGMLPNQQVEDVIFNPLGMNDTFYIPYPAAGFDSNASYAQPNRILHMKNMANGQNVRGTNTPPPGVAPCDGSYWCDVRSWPNPWPEGGLYSTPRDLFKFLAGLRDNTIPTFSATTRNRLLNDQLQPSQANASPARQSRTAGFGYVRNGTGGFVNTLTESSVYHNGFPGTTMVYDPVRRVSWFFAQQRVMQQKNYFQAGFEQFAENRVFYRMLNSMLENIRPDNLDFHFDALRANHRNLWPLRYASSAAVGGTKTDAYTGCAFSATTCDYLPPQDEFLAAGSTVKQWHDLSSQNRTMNIYTGVASPWQGNGSRFVDTTGRLGPFRLRIATYGDYGTVDTGSGSSAFTLNVWVQPHTTGNNTVVTRSIFTPFGESPTWQIAVEGGRIVANLWDTAAKRTVLGPYVTPETWYHVVAKATQNGALSLYVNGVSSGSVAVGTFQAPYGANYTVGWYTVTPPGFDIAAVNAYNQEHPAADVIRNCNGLKYRFPGMTCQ